MLSCVRSVKFDFLSVKVHNPTECFRIYTHLTSGLSGLFWGLRSSYDGDVVRGLSKGKVTFFERFPHLATGFWGPWGSVRERWVLYDPSQDVVSWRGLPFLDVMLVLGIGIPSLSLHQKSKDPGRHVLPYDFPVISPIPPHRRYGTYLFYESLCT